MASSSVPLSNTPWCWNPEQRVAGSSAAPELPLCTRHSNVALRAEAPPGGARRFGQVGAWAGAASDSPCCTELVVDRIAGRPRPNRRAVVRRTSEMAYGRQNDRTGNREVGDRRRLGRVRDHIRVGWDRVLGSSRHHSASTRRTAETAKRRLIGTVRRSGAARKLPVLGRSDRQFWRVGGYTRWTH